MNDMDNKKDIRDSFIGFSVACIAIVTGLIFLNTPEKSQSIDIVPYEPEHVFLDTVNDREFDYDAEWVQLGYSNIIDYQNDLETAKNESDGIADEAIDTYSQVITDEQIDQLKAHEEGMKTAVSFSNYQKHSDSFDEIVLACIDLMPKQAILYSNQSNGYSDGNYIFNGSGLTKSGGVYYYNGRKETWYSQREAGQHITASNIPGRNVGSDGIIRDANGYICVAASDVPLGSTIETSLGTGKVYDTGCANGTTDIYTDW